MTERDSIKHLMAGLKSQGAYTYKIPDLAKALLKPFDICAAARGSFFPIEVKLKKYSRRAYVKLEDKVLDKVSFKNREHQIPRLLEILNSGQGYPYIAACVATVQPGIVVDKRMWLIPISHFETKKEWTVAELQELAINYEMLWKPAIGWRLKGVNACFWLGSPLHGER